MFQCYEGLKSLRANLSTFTKKGVWYFSGRTISMKCSLKLSLIKLYQQKYALNSKRKFARLINRKLHGSSMKKHRLHIGDSGVEWIPFNHVAVESADSTLGVVGRFESNRSTTMILEIYKTHTASVLKKTSSQSYDFK